MNIGIIGLGIIGGACKYGFEKLGHDVSAYDIKILGSKIEDVLGTEICFICVPTPSLPDGSCDVSIVESVVADLGRSDYKGIVAIKSTVKPTTSERLKNQTNLEVCFVPEFLRERCALVDFTENHDLLAIGTDSERVFNIVKKCHGNYPKSVVQMSRTEAELLKYFSNIFNALKVVFANEMYEVCQAVGANYLTIKDSYILRGMTKDIYLDVNDSFRGYAGMCLPKDTKALAAFVKELGLDLRLFEVLEEENAKFKKTVFEGMRK
jgi:UDPglucose 6-dehydrogenase